MNALNDSVRMLHCFEDYFCLLFLDFRCSFPSDVWRERKQPISSNNKWLIIFQLNCRANIKWLSELVWWSGAKIIGWIYWRPRKTTCANCIAIENTQPDNSSHINFTFYWRVRKWMRRNHSLPRSAATLHVSESVCTLPLGRSLETTWRSDVPIVFLSRQPSQLPGLATTHKHRFNYSSHGDRLLFLYEYTHSG